MLFSAASPARDPEPVIARLARPETRIVSLTITEGGYKHNERPTAFIENRELFGDLFDDARFREPYLRTLEDLHTGGTDRTLCRFSEEDPMS